MLHEVGYATHTQPRGTTLSLTYTVCLCMQQGLLPPLRVSPQATNSGLWAGDVTPPAQLPASQLRQAAWDQTQKPFFSMSSFPVPLFTRAPPCTDRWPRATLSSKDPGLLTARHRRREEGLHDDRPALSGQRPNNERLSPPPLAREELLCRPFTRRLALRAADLPTERQE